jgi:hypothetical protein
MAGANHRKEPRLQLSDPIAQMGRRRITVQITLEPYLVEPGVVEGAERLRRAPEWSDMAELHSRHVSDETELRLLREVKAALGFTLNLNERNIQRR